MYEIEDGPRYVRLYVNTRQDCTQCENSNIRVGCQRLPERCNLRDYIEVHNCQEASDAANKLLTEHNISSLCDGYVTITNANYTMNRIIVPGDLK